MTICENEKFYIALQRMGEKIPNINNNKLNKSLVGI